MDPNLPSAALCATPALALAITGSGGAGAMRAGKSCSPPPQARVSTGA